MKDLIASAVHSLDGEDNRLYPYLPYILQDVREIGADPDVMVRMAARHLTGAGYKVADLGCGKGAISIPIARNLSCTVTGIDAIPEFIESAIKYASDEGVADRCKFFTGDIRDEIIKLSGFDLIILGAIGNVMGNVGATLRKVSSAMNPKGYVLLDDGWKNAGELTSYDKCLNKDDFYRQISSAGFIILEEEVADTTEYEDPEQTLMGAMRKRCAELSEKFPHHASLFDNYLVNQTREFDLIKNQLTCATMLLQKNV